MRIGFGKSLGNGFFVSFSSRLNLSGIAGVLVDIILLPVYLMYFMVLGIIWIVKAIARYVSWCVKSNAAETDRPLWQRKWVWSSCTIVIIVLIVGTATIMTVPKTNDVSSESALQNMDESSSQIQLFNVIQGYDKVQTVFLTISKDTSYNELLKVLDASGLYYVDRLLDTSFRSIEVYKSEEEKYTNKLDITLYKNESNDFYISRIEYIGENSGIKIEYSNEETESVCIIDSTQKSANGSLSKVDYFESKEDALNS